MAGSLLCSVLSPEGTIFEGEASFVEAHALDGRLGILPGHAPLITALGEGPLRITISDSDERRWQISGGFMAVLKDKVPIVAEGLEQTS